MKKFLILSANGMGLSGGCKFVAASKNILTQKYVLLKNMALTYFFFIFHYILIKLKNKLKT